MSKKYADFLSKDGKQWIEVHGYDDRGDPYPPDNYRSEMYPTPVEYAGVECVRVDVAWKQARSIAKKLNMVQTDYGIEHEAQCRKWARRNFGIRWSA